VYGQRRSSEFTECWVGLQLGWQGLLNSSHIPRRRDALRLGVSTAVHARGSSEIPRCYIDTHKCLYGFMPHPPFSVPNNASASCLTVHKIVQNIWTISDPAQSRNESNPWVLTLVRSDSSGSRVLEQGEQKGRGWSLEEGCAPSHIFLHLGLMQK